MLIRTPVYYSNLQYSAFFLPHKLINDTSRSGNILWSQGSMFGFEVFTVRIHSRQAQVTFSQHLKLTQAELWKCVPSACPRERWSLPAWLEPALFPWGWLPPPFSLWQRSGKTSYISTIAYRAQPNSNWFSLRAGLNWNSGWTNHVTFTPYTASSLYRGFQVGWEDLN